MKKTFLLILLCCSCLCMQASHSGYDPVKNDFGMQKERLQPENGFVSQALTPAQTANLCTLCKVWGFVKYYHPRLSDSDMKDFDMDDELVRLIPEVKSARDNEACNRILLDWVLSIGEITEFWPDGDFPDSEDIKLLPDYSWIEPAILGDALAGQLEKIKKAVKPESNPYFSLTGAGNPIFATEKKYSEMQYPDEPYRLLTLFRYWNIIQYFFPNRHLMDENWHDVLQEFVPRFASAPDEYDYKYSVLALWAKIQDTHALLVKADDVLEDLLGYRKYRLPLDVRFIEEKAVVTYLDDELGQQSGLLPGDIIETIDGVSVEDIVKEKLPITSASNYPTQLRRIADFLLKSNEKQMKLQYRRDGEPAQTTVDCCGLNDMEYPGIPAVQTIDSNIAYIYPGSFKISDMKTPAINEFMNSRGMIIDMRCYPNVFMVFDFGKYLMPKPVPFVKFTETGFKYPGLFTYSEGLKVGEINRGYYKGKIVILVDETTQSQAEYTTMAFRQAPNATVIGSTTAGADGDVSLIGLPGDIQTCISGIGVLYPDGTETQRVGIVPDIEVKPTIDGIRRGIDEPLEKAIEIINSASIIAAGAASPQIRVYPNPVADGFQVQGAEGEVKVTVTDMQGVIVLPESVAVADGYVNTTSLSRGTYLVKITSGDQTIQRKIVKI